MKQTQSVLNLHGLGGWLLVWGLVCPMAAGAEVWTVTGIGHYRVGEFDALYDAKQTVLIEAKHSALEQMVTLLRDRPELSVSGAREDELRAVLLGIGRFDQPVMETVLERAVVVVQAEVTIHVDPSELAAGLLRLAERPDVHAVVVRARKEREDTERTLRGAGEELRRLALPTEAFGVIQRRQQAIARIFALELMARAWMSPSPSGAGGSRFGDHAAARGAADLALQLDPSCGLAHATRGYIWLDEKNPRSAAIEFAAALRGRPEDGVAQIGLATAYQQQGQRDKAIEAFRQGLRQRQDDAAARLALANLLLERGDFSLAAVEYRAVLSRRPGLAEAHFGLGHVYAKLGDLSAAIGSYREGVQRKPDDAAVRFALGMTLGRQGDIDGAIAEQRRAVRLKPHDPEYRHHLGYLLSLKGELGEALAEYQAGLHLTPQDVPLHLKIGDLLQKQGDKEGAMRAYRMAASLKPNEPAAHWGLAESFAAGGNRNDAVKEYRQFLKLIEDTPATRGKIQQAQMKVAQLEARR